MNNIVDRTDRNNRIINQIMSKKIVIILTETDALHLDFLPELFNNYRSSYYFDMRREPQRFFSYALSEKIITDGTWQNKIHSYLLCRQPNQNELILSEVCSYIGGLKSDCLLFIGSAEEVQPDTFAQLQFLLGHAPDNLRIVFCGTKFLHLNFHEQNNLPTVVPHLLTEKALTPNTAVLEQYSEEEASFLTSAAALGYCNADMANTLHARGLAILTSLSRADRACVLPIGKIFLIHPSVGLFFRKKFGFRCSFDAVEAVRIEDWSKKGEWLSVLAYALHIRSVRLAETAFRALLQADKEYCLLPYLPFIPDVYPDSSCGSLLASMGKERYEQIETILSPKKDDLPDYLRKIYLRALLGLKKHKEALRYFLSFLPLLSDEELLHWYECIFFFPIDCKQKLSSSPLFIGTVDRLLNNPVYRALPFYPLFLKNIASIYNIIGDYGKCNKCLTDLHRLFPSYRYTYFEAWAFFFGSDIENCRIAAQEMLKKEQEDKNGCTGALMMAFVELYHANKEKSAEFLRAVSWSNSEKTSQNLINRALQCALLAEIGNAEYALTLAKNYTEICEYENRDELPVFYTVVAFCYWHQNNLDTAAEYARKAMNAHDRHTFFHFFAEVIHLNCQIGIESNLYLCTQTRHIVEWAQRYHADSLTVLFSNLFRPVLEIARREKIAPDYVEKIKQLLTMRDISEDVEKKVFIRFFGNAAVFAGNREILWKAKKCKELFLLYMLRPEGVDRAEIIEYVWKDYVYSSAVNNLKTTNNMIRNTLNQYGIPYSFSYANNRYKLTLDHSSDYLVYRKESAQYPEADLHKKIIIASRLIGTAEIGFFTDTDLPFFMKLRQDLRDSLSLILLELIKTLMNDKNYFDAKRFLAHLEKIDRQEHLELRYEIDKRIYGK